MRITQLKAPRERTRRTAPSTSMVLLANGPIAAALALR